MQIRGVVLVFYINNKVNQWMLCRLIDFFNLYLEVILI
ncbi:unnamed protein product [Onchocerca flexuosa]|uniref:Uncharacterized protein n=1 Tax=Onchocerca flexuosa TaxID=387005 RepID=A0A183HR96_9BILA|nr:unnamed protein product [Onchocerca flexuosa]